MQEIIEKLEARRAEARAGGGARPFRRTWIVDLCSLFVTDAPVDVPRAGNAERKIIRLVFKAAFTHVEPMAEVGVDMQFWKFAQQGRSRPRRKHRAAAMRFVIDRYPDVVLDFQRFGKKDFLPLEAPTVLAAVRGDLHWLVGQGLFDLLTKICEVILQRCTFS